MLATLRLTTFSRALALGEGDLLMEEARGGASSPATAQDPLRAAN